MTESLRRSTFMTFLPMNEKTLPDYGLISKYKTVLMGVAIIFIMFCHLDIAQVHNDVPKTFLARLLHTCTVGVDIFLLLSGVGLYYSYTKHRLPYFAFEKKRVLRILPYYLLIAGVTYLLYDVLMKHYGIGVFWRDYLFISWFRRGSTRYWYILAILVFYMLFPCIYRFIEKDKHALLKGIVFCVCWWFVIETLSLRSETAERFRIALSRLPVFILGVGCGKLSFERKEVSKPLLAVLLPLGYLALIVLLKIIPHPLYDYLYYPVRCLLGISIIATVILAMEWMERTLPALNALLWAILSWFGGLTLELYLLHQSYLILFEFPYTLLTYPSAAFCLPTMTAALIYLYRCRRRKEKAT